MAYTHRDKAIVLRSYDYGEGHRIVVLYSFKKGKIKASARGSRKIKSRFGSMLEPFSENQFFLYRKPSAEIYTVTGCSPLEANEKLRGNMISYGYASLICEAVDILSAEEDPDELVYNLLEKSMTQIVENQPAPSAWLFLFKFLKYSGYRLNMFECVRCSRRPSPATKMVFVPSEGGIGCRNCFGYEQGLISVSLGTLYDIKRISPDIELNDDSDREIGNIMVKFVKYQFKRDLKSRRFLEFFKFNEKRKNVFSGTYTKP